MPRLTPVIAAVAALAAGLVAPPRVAALEIRTASQAVTAFGIVATECLSGSQLRLIDQRQNGDGTSSPFVVPARQVFMLTSIDFEFTGATASRYTRVPVVVVNAAQTALSCITIGAALADAGGSGGGTSAIPSGFPVKPDTRLCFQFIPAVTGGSVFVHGFFAPDR